MELPGFQNNKQANETNQPLKLFATSDQSASAARRGLPVCFSFIESRRSDSTNITQANQQQGPEAMCVCGNTEDVCVWRTTNKPDDNGTCRCHGNRGRTQPIADQTTTHLRFFLFFLFLPHSFFCFFFSPSPPPVRLSRSGWRSEAGALVKRPVREREH